MQSNALVKANNVVSNIVCGPRVIGIVLLPHVLHLQIQKKRAMNALSCQLHNAKLIRSMSCKGCSPDNAACKGFFGRLKTELFYPRNWQDITIDQFIQIVDSYIRWHNEKRSQIFLGSVSPIEYRLSPEIRASTSPSYCPHPSGSMFNRR